MVAWCMVPMTASSSSSSFPSPQAQPSMLRINSTDPQVSYFGAWAIGSSGQNIPYTSTASVGAGFFLLFRGTSIKFYGILTGASSWYLEPDGIPKNVLAKGSFSIDTPSVILSVDNLQDGDHQLYGEVSAINNGTLIIHYFEIENSSGGGFQLLTAGANASNVPAQAITVDDSSPDITIHQAYWSYLPTVWAYAGSQLSTSQPGNSLSYAFDGVAIWYYCTLGPEYGFFTISIDGSRPERLSAKSNITQGQRMLWSNTDLIPGRHNLTLTHDDANSTTVSLDFFRVLREKNESAATSLSVLPTSTQTVASTNDTKIVPLAVGLTLGILTIAAIALGSICYLNRRRRKPIDLDVQPVSPYTDRVTTYVNQQQASPRDRKRPPQPTRQSGTPITSSDPTASVTGTELGPPPSYVTSVAYVRDL